MEAATRSSLRKRDGEQTAETAERAQRTQNADCTRVTGLSDNREATKDRVARTAVSDAPMHVTRERTAGMPTVSTKERIPGCTETLGDAAHSSRCSKPQLIACRPSSLVDAPVRSAGDAAMAHPGSRSARSVRTLSSLCSLCALCGLCGFPNVSQASRFSVLTPDPRPLFSSGPAAGGSGRSSGRPASRRMATSR